MAIRKRKRKILYREVRKTEYNASRTTLWKTSLSKKGDASCCFIPLFKFLNFLV